MPRFKPYNYDQDAMVEINCRHQLLPGSCSISRWRTCTGCFLRRTASLRKPLKVAARTVARHTV